MNSQLKALLVGRFLDGIGELLPSYGAQDRAELLLAFSSELSRLVVGTEAGPVELVPVSVTMTVQNEYEGELPQDWREKILAEKIGPYLLKQKLIEFLPPVPEQLSPDPYRAWRRPNNLYEARLAVFPVQENKNVRWPE